MAGPVRKIPCWVGQGLHVKFVSLNVHWLAARPDGWWERLMRGQVNKSAVPRGRLFIRALTSMSKGQTILSQHASSAHRSLPDGGGLVAAQCKSHATSAAPAQLVVEGTPVQLITSTMLQPECAMTGAAACRLTGGRHPCSTTRMVTGQATHARIAFQVMVVFA
jgi:hypothetical protein